MANAASKAAPTPRPTSPLSGLCLPRLGYAQRGQSLCPLCVLPRESVQGGRGQAAPHRRILHHHLMVGGGTGGARPPRVWEVQQGGRGTHDKKASVATISPRLLSIKRPHARLPDGRLVLGRQIGRHPKLGAHAFGRRAAQPPRAAACFFCCRLSNNQPASQPPSSSSIHPSSSSLNQR